MPDRLLLRLHLDDTLAWLAQDAAGRALSGGNVGAPPVETIARAQRIVCLVPSEQVLLLDTPVLSKQHAQLAKAVPFALEDRLASPVEDLHFALGAPTADASIAVAVVARDVLRGWIDTLAQQGIRADVLIPETLALPWVDGQATLLIEDDRALLRSGVTQASTCDLASLPAWLEASAPTAPLQVFDFRAAPAQTLPVKIASYHERQRDALAFFATQLGLEPAPNLLQGEFAPQHRQMPAQRLWRFAAMFVGAALLLGFVYSVGDWLALRSESARLDAAMREVLHTSFPKFDKVDGDPHQLMQSELARLRGDEAAGGVLRVLGQIAPVLGSSTRVVVRGLEYHNSTLELALRAPDVQALDLVRERLGNLGGLKAEVTSVNPFDGGVDGRVRITAGKS
jgi:general secretion pathway protein L